MSARALYHGPALDAALKRAEDPTGLFAEVCETALLTRSRAEADAQLSFIEDEAVRRETADMLRRAQGREPTTAEVSVVLLRSAIGGAFNRGLQAGLELRHESRSVTA